MIKFMDYEVLNLLKELKIPIYIEYENQKKIGNIISIPVYILRFEEEPVLIGKIIITYEKLNNIMNKDYKYLHELFEDELMSYEELKNFVN